MELTLWCVYVGGCCETGKTNSKCERKEEGGVIEGDSGLVGWGSLFELRFVKNSDQSVRQLGELGR